MGSSSDKKEKKRGDGDDEGEIDAVEAMVHSQQRRRRLIVIILAVISVALVGLFIYLRAARGSGQQGGCNCDNVTQANREEGDVMEFFSSHQQKPPPTPLPHRPPSPPTPPQPPEPSPQQVQKNLDIEEVEADIDSVNSEGESPPEAERERQE